MVLVPEATPLNQKTWPDLFSPDARAIFYPCSTIAISVVTIFLKLDNLEQEPCDGGRETTITMIGYIMASALMGAE